MVRVRFKVRIKKGGLVKVRVRFRVKLRDSVNARVTKRLAQFNNSKMAAEVTSSNYNSRGRGHGRVMLPR